jgi:hypothetical protein
VNLGVVNHPLSIIIEDYGIPSRGGPAIPTSPRRGVSWEPRDDYSPVSHKAGFFFVGTTTTVVSAGLTIAWPLGSAVFVKSRLVWYKESLRVAVTHMQFARCNKRAAARLFPAGRGAVARHAS